MPSADQDEPRSVAETVRATKPIDLPPAGPSYGTDKLRVLVESAARELPTSPSDIQDSDPTPRELVPTVNSLVRPLEPRAERATLTIIVGPNAGSNYVLENKPVTIGRDPAARICVDDPAVSRFHAVVDRLPDGRYVVHDLQSTNGTLVGAQPVKTAELVSGTRIQLGPSVVVRFGLTDETEEQLHRRIYEAATRDTLTGAFNRRALMERLQIELAIARRSSTPLSLLVVDVDGFKLINDSFGHLQGDYVLRAIAARIAQQVRVGDALARWGGDEFVAVLRDTPHSPAVRLAERLRHSVAAEPIPTTTQRIWATISVGVASLGECSEHADVEDLLALADSRLYRAKFAGRNRVMPAE